MKLLASFGIAVITLCAGAGYAQAGSLYWDTNGTTAGAGATPTGTWDGVTTFWNSDSTGAAGGSLGATTTSADDLIFVAGADVTTSGTGAYTVTVSGIQAAKSLDFQTKGNAILTGGTISLDSGGITGDAFVPTTGTSRGTVTISSAINLTGASDTSFINNGSAAMTFSGGVTSAGSTNLILKSNSTGALTIAATNNAKVNNSGSITNSGAGTGVVTIGTSGSAGILGSNVTSLTQNSITSGLTLVGITNSGGFNGPVSILSGTLTNNGTVSLLGSGTITISATTGSIAALFSGAGLTNAIKIQGSGTNMLFLSNVGVLYNSNTTTLLNSATLTISSAAKNGITDRIVESGGTSGVNMLLTAANQGFSQSYQWGNTSNTYSGGTVITISGSTTSMAFGGTALGTAQSGTGSYFGQGSIVVKGANAAAIWCFQGIINRVNGFTDLTLDTDMAVKTGTIQFDGQTVTLGDANNIGTTRKFGVAVGQTLTLSGTIRDGTINNVEVGNVSGFFGGLTVFSGADTYTGSTTVTSGTLQISGGNDRLPTGTTLIVNSGTSAAAAGVFDLNTRNQTVGGLSGNSTNSVLGTVTNMAAGSGTSTLTVNSTAADSTYNGIITNGTSAKVGLTKSGAFTLTLNGTNTYSGATNVNGGTLVISGSLAGTTVVTVANSSTLKLGASNLIKNTATLTLNTGVLDTQGNNQTFSTLTIGTGVSILNLQSGASIVNFDSSSGQTWTGTLSIYNWSGTATTGGGTDQVIFNSQGLTQAQLDSINFYSDAGTTFLGTAGWASGNISEIVAVPEPGTWAMVLSGVGMLLFGQRIRRRSVR